MNPVPTIDTCWLPLQHRVGLADLATAFYPNEVGGILAGYINDGAIVVTDIVGPGLDAQHRRNSFLPDHGFHKIEMQRIYEASCGIATYLGDWHSHPDGVANLSKIDRNTLQAIADAEEAQCPRPLMVLLAGNPNNWRINAFVYDRTCRRLGSPTFEVDIQFY